MTWETPRSVFATLALAIALAAPAGALTLDDDVLPLPSESEEPEEPEVADFSSAFFHTYSANGRGEDVRAIQYLLRARGHSVTADGFFGSTTTSAVKSFQTSQGLASDGIVGPATWGKLVVTVQTGSTGDAVKAVQNLLNHKRASALVVDGVFGANTYNAVRTFQTHAGITSDGIVGPTTWKNLVWHYEQPASSSSLCAYGSSGNRWGTAGTVGYLESAASLFASRGYGKVSVGDLSLEHGGDIAGHASHEVGLDVDIRPIRTDAAQCTSGTSVGQSTFSSSRSLQLCQDIRARASGHVKLILWNDPASINAGCSQYYDNHDNHLHVRYCEKVHPNPSYQC